MCNEKLVYDKLDKKTDIRCTNCKNIYGVYRGCIDFTEFKNKNYEKDYYNEVYSLNNDYYPYEDQIVEKSDRVWFDNCFPSGRDIIAKMGNLQNKTILCLGNGLSLKELYFAKMGADLWVTDLSINSMIKLKSIISNLDDFNIHNVHLHAVDAFSIPFDNSSFDIVYGFAFVHHLKDKIPFLR